MSMTTIAPTRLRALSAGWEPAPAHRLASLADEQIASIRTGFDGTTGSLRRLTCELGLPFYLVRETALSLGLRNAQQPPRKRRRVTRSNSLSGAWEVAS